VPSPVGLQRFHGYWPSAKPALWMGERQAVDGRVCQVSSATLDDSHHGPLSGEWLFSWGGFILMPLKRSWIRSRRNRRFHVLIAPFPGIPKKDYYIDSQITARSMAGGIDLVSRLPGGFCIPEDGVPPAIATHCPLSPPLPAGWGDEAPR
jgi:hypothetical protein